MTRAKVMQLEPGARIRVRFGNRGSQLAVVVARPRRDGQVPALKWRAHSGKWTARVLVPAEDVLERLPPKQPQRS